MRLRRERRVDGNKIALQKESVEIDSSRSEFASPCPRFGNRIVEKHVHIEPTGSARHRMANTAEAGNTKCLAVNVLAEVHHDAPAVEFPGAQEPVGFDYPARDSHEQCPRKIRSRLGQYA